MFENLQKLIPWVSNLPVIPKVAVTIVVMLTCFVLLYLVWAPPAGQNPADNKNVQDAYARMQRVLSKINNIGGQITVDGTPIELRLEDYYKPYLAIAQYVSSNPKNMKGAYEAIWEHGGQGRVYISDTQPFEAVVSAFFREWETAAQAKN
jgi:hypothetical protein